jgi:hypothetical protein
MLHQGRYRSSLRNPPARQPPMCLQYAIWAIAAIMTPEYKHLSEVYYRRSRNYVEADEMRVSLDLRIATQINHIISNACADAVSHACSEQRSRFRQCSARSVLGHLVQI